MRWSFSAEAARAPLTPSDPVLMNGDKTRYMVNVPTEETGRIAFFANESRGEAAGGNSQMHTQMRETCR
jgi:hypothetical protein